MKDRGAAAVQGGGPRTSLRVTDATLVPWPAVAVIAGATAVAALLLRFRFSLYSPRGRVMVEVVITSCTLVSAWWLAAKFKRRRRLSNLLTAAALVVLAAQSLVFFGLPSLTAGAGGNWFGGLAPDAAWPVVGALLAIAAFTPRHLLVPQGHGWPAAAALTGTSLLLTILADLQPASAWPSSSLRVQHVLVAAVLLLMAGVGFSRSALRQRKPLIASCLASASIVLAAASSYDVLMPNAATETLSGRDFLRLIVSGLILTVALATHRRVLKAESAEVAARERRRLVRDLHDGMAQDLAFIAAHGERLANELGPGHPLVVAASRALAACRGVMVDLSASSAPSAAAALRMLADELSCRHRVRIVVDAGESDDLPLDEREEVVRIAREAIVNAVEHGRADTIVASLRTQGRHLSLNVYDDGCGIEPRASSGADRGRGFRTMRERAATLGGRLTIERRPEGGTSVQVVV